MKQLVVVFLICSGTFLVAQTLDFPKYSYNLDQIMPLYLSSNSENRISDTTRQFNSFSEELVLYFDQFLRLKFEENFTELRTGIKAFDINVTDFDKLLTAISLNDPEITSVYKVNNPSSGTNHHFIIKKIGRYNHIIPLDNNFAEFYDPFVSGIRSLDSVFEGFNDIEFEVTKILYGDVDGDDMLDLFYLVNSEPVLVVEN